MEEVARRPPQGPRRVPPADGIRDPLPHGRRGQGEEELLLRGVAPPKGQGVRQAVLREQAVHLRAFLVRQQRIFLELRGERVLIDRKDQRAVGGDAAHRDGVAEDHHPRRAHPAALPGEETAGGEETGEPVDRLRRTGPRRRLVRDPFQVGEHGEQLLHGAAVALPFVAFVQDRLEPPREKLPHRPREGSVPRGAEHRGERLPQGAHLRRQKPDLGGPPVGFPAVLPRAPTRRRMQPGVPVGAGDDHPLPGKDVPQVGARFRRAFRRRPAQVRGREDFDHGPPGVAVARRLHHAQQETDRRDGRERDVDAPRRRDPVLSGDPLPVRHRFRGHLPGRQEHRLARRLVEPPPDPAGGEAHLPFRVGGRQDGKRHGERGRGGPG